MVTTNDRHISWFEILLGGSGHVFFGMHSDDEQLAEALNKLFADGPEITAEEIRRDRERFDKIPVRGTERRKEFASPTKNVILNKAGQLNVQEALAEILDNIFDNFERNTNKSQRLEVSIVGYRPRGSIPGELVIRENSGGIPGNRVVPLIQLGASNTGSQSIGAWGEGFKMAVFALGEEVEVFSSAPSETPISIHFPKGWLDQGDPLWTRWEVDVHNVSRNAPPLGSTVIRINYLSRQSLQTLGLDLPSSDTDADEVALRLAKNFGEIYAEKFRKLVDQGCEIAIEIRLGSVSVPVTFLPSVEQRLQENLAFLPWLRPIRWIRTYEVNIPDENRLAKLNVTVYAGLYATEYYSPRYEGQVGIPGVEMWGNGRLFSLKGRISDSSVGWAYMYGGKGGRNPESNASSRRLTIVALFTADQARDIPWAAPVKNDYNRRSEFYAELRDTFARVIQLFKNSLSLLDAALLPFSAAWPTYSEEQRLTILFRDVNPTLEFLDNFKQSRFGRKVLSFQPILSFKPVDLTEDESLTAENLYGVQPTEIRDIERAASATKQSPAERLKFLEAIFHFLARQAEVEERMGLSPDEEFDL